jgi:hypothetical protein
VRLLALLLCWIPGSAAALVLAVDLSQPGDGLVTRDTDSGLEWLDLTLTTNLSWNEVEAGAGGWLAAGWRRATGQEVCGLMGSFGFAPSSCPSPFPGLQTPLSFPAAGAAVQPHLDLLGTTWAESIDGNVNSTSAIGWFSHPSNHPACGTLAMIERQAFTNVPIDRGRVDVWTHICSAGIGQSSKATTTGHFLVREVPEPAACGLVLVASLPVATRLRRPRAR